MSTTQRIFVAAIAGALFAAAAPSMARAPVGTEPDQVARLFDEGFNHSQIASIAEWLSDRIGGRMTNSPAMRTSEVWTQQQFTQWGLTNVHREGFEFGRGWSIEKSSVRMTAPRSMTLRSIPIAWTPSTLGAIIAPIVVAPIKEARDFDAWRGKLNGKIVLIDLPTAGSEPGDALFRRLSNEDIAKLDRYPIPIHTPDILPKPLRSVLFVAAIDAFLKAEGALVMVRQARHDGGVLFGEGYQHERGGQLPAVELAAEDYRRLARLSIAGPVTLEVDSRVSFHDEDSQAYNILADLPGTDPKSGYVMAGAHLDSWVAGDGAADDGAGVAIVMEAARILSHLGVKPKRTIRFALWAGEEQGLVGSTAYIERHLARRGKDVKESDTLTNYAHWPQRYPIEALPEFGQLAGYFNFDNGSGKVRGIYAEGNVRAVPILEKLIAPLHSLGVEQIVAQRTGQTDHAFMASLGLPAFQFIQDPLDYLTRVHHSTLDTYDHLKIEDLRQAAVVLAVLLLQTANLEQTLPRMPLATPPALTDPFATPDPDDLR